MARKRKEILKEGPIDRVDLFLRENVKKILLVVMSIIIVVFGAMGIRAASGKSVATEGSIIAAMEMSASTLEEVEAYAALANKYKHSKDYIHLSSAQKYVKLHEVDKAMGELALVGGQYKEFANSLSYDINEGKDPKGTKIDVLKYARGGLLSSVWYYRAIKEDPTNEALIAEYRGVWPNSRLGE